MPFRLTSGVVAGAHQRVQVDLTVSGDLKFNHDGAKVRTAPLKVTGHVTYDERILADAPKVRSVRHYQAGKADIRVGGHSGESQLSDSNRLILCETTQDEAALCSLAGPMRREEIDLLELPCDSLALSRLLPEGEVKEGESWSPDSASVALVMRVEMVNSHDVKCTLEKAAAGRAIVLVQGSVQGSVGGVSTEIEIKARFGYDLSERRVNSLAINWREQRAISHAEPGFDVTANLRMTLQPLRKPAETLTDAALARVALDTDPRMALVRLTSSEGGFEFLHDPRWRAISDQRPLTVLRLVDRGELIAQCNMSKLPSLAEGRRISVDRFRGDVESALKDNQAQIMDASESTTEGGLHVIRVTAAGTVSELEILWTYCHISDPQGRRASFVFTRESKLAERSASAEETIIEHFRFVDTPAGNQGEPTPAKVSRSGTPEVGSRK